MSHNDLHKSFTPNLTHIINQDGEILNTQTELAHLAKDVHTITDIATYTITPELLKEYMVFAETAKTTIPNSIGKQLRITTPENIFPPLKHGKSRFQWLINDRVVRELKSWAERIKAVEGTSDQHVSQGWARTANGNKPGLLAPKMSLSTVDKQYASIVNNPFDDGHIELKMLINGEWRTLFFDFDTERFSGVYKVCLPDVIIKDDELRFIFSAAYSYVYSGFSPEYVVSVDVGITSFATVSVVNVETGEAVYSTGLSSLVRGLWNRVRAAQKQVQSLQRKGRSGEAVTHKVANSRRKRELAILAGQEIAQLAHEWGNAIVLVEDLSWLVNTMRQGRWNRGALVKWVTHYAELNGSRVMRVNPKNSSQLCPKCLCEVVHPEWSVSKCVSEGCERFGLLQDRDVAATEVLAGKFIRAGSLGKSVETRRASKKFTRKKVQRSPRVEKRKGYRDSRVKLEATPSRRKSRKKTVRSFDGLEVVSLRLPSPRVTVVGDDTARKGRRRVTVTSKGQVSFTHKDYP